MRFISFAFAVIALTLPSIATAQASQMVQPNTVIPPLSSTYGPQAPVSDGLDVSSFLNTRPYQATGSGEPTESAFRLNCPPFAPNQYNDGIVYPNQPGASPHLHTGFGNTSPLWYAGYSNIRTNGLSSCFNPLWRSQYWMPSMMRYKPDGTVDVKMPAQIRIYYKRPPMSAPACTPGNAAYVGRCVPLPNGIVGIAGSDLVTNTVPNGYVTFKCVVETPNNLGGYSSRDYTREEGIVSAAAGCPTPPSSDTSTPRKLLDVHIVFPECWNGKDLDTPNHRSHWANLLNDGNGRFACPLTHPYRTWQYSAQVVFDMDEYLPTDGTWYTGKPGWYLSSDRMFGMPMYRPGGSIHFDLRDGINETAKAKIEDNCMNRNLSCSDGDLGDGTGLKKTWVDLNLKVIYPRPAAAKEPSKVRLHRPS